MKTILNLILFFSGSSSKRSRVTEDLSWRVTREVPGGPDNDLVIPSFLGHVASRMWTGKPENIRGVLKCQNRSASYWKLLKWYDRLSDAGKTMVTNSGLSYLRETMFQHLDHSLISAFIERWQPDTNSFHMPFGEMTIMLHDVWHILRLPVEGEILSGNPSSAQLQGVCMDLLQVSRAELLQYHWDGGAVLVQSVENYCGASGMDETQAIGWMWLLLGSTLFVDKSGNRIKPSILHEMQNGVEGLDKYSWGTGTLAHLYRQLGMASRGDSKSVCGCLTLLQAWIYEYFPCFRPSGSPAPIEDNAPMASRWTKIVEGNRIEARLNDIRIRLDGLEASEVQNN